MVSQMLSEFFGQLINKAFDFSSPIVVIIWSAIILGLLFSIGTIIDKNFRKQQKFIPKLKNESFQFSKQF